MEYPLNIYITAHTLISSLGFGISENKKAIHDYRSGIRMQEAGRISDSPILAGMIDSVELEKRAKELLEKRAKELDYDYVVTGHYARIEEQDGKFLLKKAIDEKKDQSYVLYSLTQEQLAHTLFPLGGMTKPQIREMAEEQGLINARKHDSQDICFVPDGDYAGFIERYTGKSFEPGNFVDQEGHVLGQHKGIICYTIGQRKGLGLALHEPMYVCRIDPKTNTVVLGRDRDLWSKELTAKDFHWISGEVPTGTQRIKAKIRYRHQEQWANAEITGPDSIHLVFDEPQRAITCGQSVVLYDGDVVVGGGTINGLCGSGSGMESE